MRIHDILTESEIQQLDEGPKLDAFGRGVGKVVGGVAKGVGAVAGGAVGAYNALKKGFQTGKAVVGDDPDPNAGAPGYTAPVEPAARTPNTEPTPAPSTTTPPSAAEINAQGPEGSAPAKTQSGDAGKALAKSTAVVDKTQAQSQEKANQTVYAQVKANVDKLDKKGKQRILQMLQKSLSAPAPKAAAAPGAGAFGNMAAQLSGEKPNTMANAPVSKTNVATPGNPNAAPADPAVTAPVTTKARGGRVAGAAPSQSASAVRRRNNRAAARSANSAGAGAMGQMANTLQQQNASKNNYGNALSEALAHRIEVHKQKMFETGLSRGSISVFRK
jgi:hypothetical protein